MNENTWNRFAPIYNAFMGKDRKVYEQMYELIRKTVRRKNVLELATGTGLIAKNIVRDAKQIEATDYSPKMIEIAKKSNRSSKLHFSIQDACNLPYGENTFDVVIISNALHVMLQPEKALEEIQRVLKPEGILIAPTFTQGQMKATKKFLARLMTVTGFQTEHKWTSEEYMIFLMKYGWTIKKYKVLNASFPLTYVECQYKEDKV